MENSALKRGFVIVFAAVSALGFIDASYLTITYFSNTSPVCSILEGCDIVTSSIYSSIGVIPVALLGAIYYLALTILAIAYLDRKNEKLIRFGFWATWAGFLASLYFVFIQLFVLEEICLYCMGSALTSTILFIMGMLGLKRLSEN